MKLQELLDSGRRKILQTKPPRFHSEQNTLSLQAETKMSALLTPVRVQGQFSRRSVIVAALWDTGAQSSMISTSIAQQLQLLKMGTAPMSGVLGRGRCPMYGALLWVTNECSFPGIFASFDGDFGHDVLIGMDIISQGDFVVSSHGGKCLMSFRVPSQGVPDFTKHD